MLPELKKLAQFKSFTEEDRANLGMQSNPCSFKAGETVFKDAAKGDEMYIILQGEAQVSKKVNGKDVIIAMLKPGEVFGEMALLEDLPRSADVKAKSNCELLCISKANLDTLRDKHVGTALKLMDIMVVELSHRIREANNSLEIVKFWIT